MDCNSAAKASIHKMFIDDCVSLFDFYGCNSLYRSDIDGAECANTIGVIDAGGFELELTLILNVPFSILALSYPCQDAILETSEEQLEDWLLELANQLMGKLKGRLVKQNLFVSLGLPQSFFDTSDFMSNTLIQSSEKFIFEVDGELMECMLLVDIKTESLSIEECAEDDSFSGEIELF